jgi:mono/diheme cytochrome c family protein
MTRTTFLLLALAACGPDNWGPDELRDGKSVQSQKQLEEGRQAYAMYCVGCHGEKGDGNGPAARFLSPKPRDFRVGRLKFAAVPANSPPTDDDYLRVMQHGLHGTAMPAWSLVPLSEQKAIVAYIKTFYPNWAKDDPVPPVVMPADPWRGKPEAGIAEGERLYHGFAACYNCHPAYATKAKISELSASYKMPVSEFRPALYESVEKESDWGANIRPPDFLSDRIKLATSRDLLALVIATGVGGTAMPSWASSLTPEQLWGLTYYVESLIAKRGTPAAAALQQSLRSQP